MSEDRVPTPEASPLQEIERGVQLRAKEVSLDLAGDGGRAKLRSLIADEVRAWSDAYKRGLRAFDLADPDVVAERAYRNLAGYAGAVGRAPRPGLSSCRECFPSAITGWEGR